MGGMHGRVSSRSKHHPKNRIILEDPSLPVRSKLRLSSISPSNMLCGKKSCDIDYAISSAAAMAMVDELETAPGSLPVREKSLTGPRAWTSAVTTYV